MVTSAMPVNKSAASQKAEVPVKITIFHCINALDTTSYPEDDTCDVSFVHMPCSGMTREVFLLRAFEAGADAVGVAVCPEDSCRYVQGSLRARKRVKRVKKILDDIGLDGRRLELFTVSHGDSSAVASIINQTRALLTNSGTSTAA